MREAVEGLSDRERFPLLDEDGARMLSRLRQHPNAPRWNLATGDRLDAAMLERVRQWEAALGAPSPGWTPGRPPDWVDGFAAGCAADVPIYRRGGTAAFASRPTVTRADLAREPWSFVPDSQPLDNLMTFYTSGTTGKPMYVITHPEVPAKKLALYRRALRACGADLVGGPGRVAIAFVCSQAKTLTYATVSSLLNQAGAVKVNLHPSQWNDPGDRVRFLDECDPEVLTGDPIGFADLADLPVTIRPRALVSSAMTVTPGLRARLESRFGCPVVDIYSTCESGPIAMARGDAYEVLPDDLYVEILDERGAHCPPGVAGEITLTGGRNPFLPLLRYRTGDYAAIETRNGAPVLTQFDGRAPVRFRTMDGQWINNIDVAAALRTVPLTQISLLQRADGSLLLKARGCESESGLRAAIGTLFGEGQSLAIEPMPDDVWKAVPYASELEYGS
ncbi:MAG: AMP-binding protein [Thermoanaerobaculia bacterium]|nr:AMP-binding protein [Thermoanaerobaculia bacterium]